MIRGGDRGAIVAAAGFLLIGILQSFAFALSDNPFYLESIGWSFSYIILFVTIICFFYLAQAGKLTINAPRVLIISSVFINWILAYTHSYGHLSINSLLIPIALSVFVMSNDELLAQTYSLFYKLIFCMSAFSIIAYVCYWGSLLSPHNVVPFYEELTMSDYVSYIFSYILQPPIGLPRSCGLYNEPGMFGTMGALVLVAEGMKMNKYNIVILIAGILTLSVAFVILIVIYYALRALMQKEFKILIILIVLLATILYLPTLNISDDYLSLVLRRFVFVEGRLRGDNRDYGSEGVWNSLLDDNWKLLFGYGQYMIHGQVTSYKRLIINHGIIGTSLFLIPLFWGAIGLAKKKSESVLFTLVFLSSIYQRPEIYNMAYFVVIIGGVARIKKTQCT